MGVGTHSGARRAGGGGAALAVAVALAAAGCGSSGNPGASTARGDSTGSGPASASVAATSSGGTSTGGSRGTTPPSASRRRFLASVNTICAAVRGVGAVALSPHPDAAAIRSYSSREAILARRTTTSFDHLRGPTTDLVVLRPLYGDYARLDRIYSALAGTRATGRSRSLLAGLTRAERRTGADAARAGLPACGPRESGQVPAAG